MAGDDEFEGNSPRTSFVYKAIYPLQPWLCVCTHDCGAAPVCQSGSVRQDIKLVIVMAIATDFKMITNDESFFLFCLGQAGVSGGR